MQKSFALLAATVGATTQYDFKPDNANLTTHQNGRSLPPSLVKAVQPQHTK